MAFKEIVWSELAKTELANVLEFYVENNGSSSYSLKLLKELDDLLKTLSQNEFIGRLTKNKFTRAIPMKYYSIFYEVNGNRIEIISFWDNRQNPSSSKVKS
ncbi:MAG: type II toxin-antitoxin system RelE/ParE family toxin [Pedobacter sp.]|nr:MAG: type II toxin-antitoxin system RelE/ParE family toxin [Pedobacter sp.]